MDRRTECAFLPAPAANNAGATNMATDLELQFDATDDDLARPLSGNGQLPSELPLSLVVTDRDTIAELWLRREGEPRDDYALEALRIGVLALRQARGQLDADLIQRESQRMLGALEAQLRSHAQ